MWGTGVYAIILEERPLNFQILLLMLAETETTFASGFSLH
jgi:hypothetical protein